ncbi:MAG TPA: DUF3822 family protein [Sphingobacterium sp.]|nr:DUF3822 family protein [Sphingobacterium sp.]
MDYTSADFKIQYISTYTLYINSDYTNDQVVVLDNENCVLVLKTYGASQPSQDVAKLLSLPFQRVYIALPHQNLVWVPTTVFRDSDIDDFVPFFEGSGRILSKEFPSLGVTALYQYDVLLYSRWRKIFAEAHFVPVFEVTLKQAQPQIPIQGSVLGVYVYDSQVDLFLFEHGEFKFYNTFEVATADDMSYFVLQLFKNLGIAEKVGKVLLSGADAQSTWGQRLALYTDNLEMVKAKNRWTVASADISDVVGDFNMLADSVLCV